MRFAVRRPMVAVGFDPPEERAVLPRGARAPLSLTLVTAAGKRIPATEGVGWKASEATTIVAVEWSGRRLSVSTLPVALRPLDTFTVSDVEISLL